MNYLNEQKIIDTNKIINLDYNFFAHKKKVGSKIVYEKLITHIELANKYFFSICREKNIDEIFKRFEEIPIR